MSQVTHIGLSLLGYSRGQVEKLIQEKDHYIKELEQKLATLEEKFSYYETIEQDLKDSIVDARITGNKIISESNETAEKLVSQTNQQIAGYREEFAQQSQALLHTGTDLRNRMKDMQSDMLAILSEYQAMLSATDFDALYPDQAAQRFDIQLTAYEAEELVRHKQDSQATNLQEPSMSEEEKRELQKLIHEVIANELDTNLDNELDEAEAEEEDETAELMEKVSGSDSVEESNGKKGSSVHFLPKKRKA